MDQDEWISDINKLDIWSDLKNKIIDLFFNPNNNFQFYKINNDAIKQAFINIKSYKNIYISFDIEFQTVLTNNNVYKTDVNSRGDKIASFPREFGMLVLVRDKNNNVYYLGSIHRNFRPLTNYGINSDYFKYMLEMYTTVTDGTRGKLIENDKIFMLDDEIEKLKNGDYDSLIGNELFRLESESVQNKVIDIINELKFQDDYEKNRKINLIIKLLQKVPFATYGKYIKNKKIKDKFNSQFKLYYDDQFVKERMMTKNEELNFTKAFLNISKDSCFIIKGIRDLDAMYNIAKMLKLKENYDFNHTYDIEIFNGFSKTRYNDAKLEATYQGIIASPIYEENKQDLKQMQLGIVGFAHNPVIDSYYTLIIALIINMGLNDYFPELNNLMGGNIYFHMYLKEKKKYDHLKNK